LSRMSSSVPSTTSACSPPPSCGAQASFTSTPSSVVRKLEYEDSPDGEELGRLVRDSRKENEIMRRIVRSQANVLLRVRAAENKREMMDCVLDKVTAQSEANKREMMDCVFDKVAAQSEAQLKACFTSFMEIMQKICEDIIQLPRALVRDSMSTLVDMVREVKSELGVVQERYLSMVQEVKCELVGTNVALAELAGRVNEAAPPMPPAPVAGQRVAASMVPASMDAGPSQAPPAAPARSPGRRVDLDYSRFEDVEDSDDEGAFPSVDEEYLDSLSADEFARMACEVMYNVGGDDSL